MNKKNFIKGTTLPVALFFTIATFAPAWGLQTASAAIEVVQQQSTIKGTVVDSQGEPIIGFHSHKEKAQMKSLHHYCDKGQYLPD